MDYLTFKILDQTNLKPSNKNKKQSQTDEYSL